VDYSIVNMAYERFGIILQSEQYDEDIGNTKVNQKMNEGKFGFYRHVYVLKIEL